MHVTPSLVKEEEDRNTLEDDKPQYCDNKRTALLKSAYGQMITQLFGCDGVSL